MCNPDFVVNLPFEVHFVNKINLKIVMCLYRQNYTNLIQKMTVSWEQKYSLIQNVSDVFDTAGMLV